MNRSAFIIVFFSAQLLFVILQIHKHTLITKLSYLENERESEKLALLNRKQQLTNEWYKVTDRELVQHFAEQHLQFRPISLKQVKKVSQHDNQTIQN